MVCFQNQLMSHIKVYTCQSKHWCVFYRYPVSQHTKPASLHSLSGSDALWWNLREGRLWNM